ncbi:PEP-utilizing enzyme [Oscillatoria sp. CS-180]|uniref:putative PEP-binding protein n=1 Tax=Oscillatoria sp. CS-180 TaxID=3021720 RepID=UPI00232AAF99|nr:putative PEP-binding protein [Oscillatoria sp. CS-180]MDB9525132.1 PEP-utilizing enzyme [Oscillatoria sp. CS-180]
MISFHPLKAIADDTPQQIGEMAHLLHQLQREGQSIPDSWIVPAAEFRKTLQKLTAREPLYADWPHLLWQSKEYSVSHLARRLQHPLLNLSLSLPWPESLLGVEGTVVRLWPSLWFGNDMPTIPFTQMLEAPLCWAEPEALNTAVKRLWLSVLNAKSLTFWNRWSQTHSVTPPDHPSEIEVAIVVQRIDPTVLSGTLTVQANQMVLEAVCGLPEAIAECYPDTFRGRLPDSPRFKWQAGYQEQSYHLANHALSIYSSNNCWVTRPQTQTALEIVNETTAAQLWTLAKRLNSWSDRTLRVGWSLTDSGDTLQVLWAGWWPMVAPPPSTSVNQTRHPASGYAASGGKSEGIALVLKTDSPLPTSAHRHIVVASEVLPEWLPLLKTAAGIVSERGGLTSHAAVLARELGLPAIVGMPQATERFHTGDILRLDGDRGLIETRSVLSEETWAATATFAPPSSALNRADQTKIWLNLSQPDTVAAIASLPVAGVGLLRSEWLMMSVLDRQHPYQWIKAEQQEILIQRLLEQLRPILQAFFPRPVRYRTLDIRSNEFAQLTGAPAVESNPMIGLRGAFSYRQHPAFFQLELELLNRLQNEGYDNLHVILPFVRTVEEFIDCKNLIQAAGLDQSEHFKLWIMAEVPSVLFLLPRYVAAGVQGIAIGSHDLTQLLLGIDRDQGLFSEYFDVVHPAVEMAIAQLIQHARSLDIPCQLCGVSPILHPSSVEATIRQGMTDISVDVAALEAMSQILHRITEEQ